MRYTAYVPCFNNAATIRAAVEAVWAQSIPPAEVLVVDDGSSDDSVSRLAGLDVRVVRHSQNRGRGAVRARAMQEARHELVLACDATNILAREFAAGAFSWFEHASIAAVYGHIGQPEGGSAVHRWRGRHLFKLSPTVRREPGVVPGGSFATCGAVVRRSAALSIGNYAPSLRHSEDADFGRRLSAGGWSVAFDPALRVTCIVQNSLAEVLERYWRWHAGPDERVSWGGYAHNIRFSLSVAAREWRDPAVAAITLGCPHYCFWRSRRRAGARRSACAC